MNSFSQSKGVRLLLAVIVACFIAGVITAIATIPFKEASALSLVSFIAGITVLGPVVPLPGYFLAYMLVKSYKKKLGLGTCIIGGVIIGTLVGFVWMPAWSDMERLMIPIFSGGPLTGLIYYFLQEKSDNPS